MAHYEQGQYQEAIAVCDLILKWTPFNSHVLYVKGQLLYNIRCDQEAIINYDLAMKYARISGVLDFYAAWTARGDALLELRKSREALDNYDRATKYQKGKVKHPNEQAAIWAKRGLAQFQLNLYTEALSSFENALSYCPDNWYFLTWKGNVLTPMEQYAEALHSFEQALALQPDFVDAVYGKACCYALQGNIDKAIENLAQSLVLDPERFCNHAKTDADLGSIRADARVQELLQTKFAVSPSATELETCIV